MSAYAFFRSCFLPARRVWKRFGLVTGSVWQKDHAEQRTCERKVICLLGRLGSSLRLWWQVVWGEGQNRRACPAESAMPSPALTIATAAAAAAVPKNLWASLLAHGYSATLLTHPFQLKTLTSMFVNPIGGAIGQIMKDGKITSWREIRLFMVWGLGLGGPLPFPPPHPTRNRTAACRSPPGARGCMWQARRRTSGTKYCSASPTGTSGTWR